MDATVDAKVDAKGDAKMDAKVDVKMDVKVDAKIDAKTDAKTDAKVDARVDVQAPPPTPSIQPFLHRRDMRTTIHPLTVRSPTPPCPTMQPSAKILCSPSTTLNITSSSEHLPSTVSTASALHTNLDTNSISIARNLARIQQATSQNQQLIGTYVILHHRVHKPLPSDVRYFLPAPIILESTSQHHGFPLLPIIQSILQHPCPTPLKPEFRFECSTEAALHNASLLQSHDYDLHACISQSPTTCRPGSEFRDVKCLDALFHLHSLWPKVRAMLSLGAITYLSHEPSEDQRLRENEALLHFNNHKGAQAVPDIISKSLSSEVSFGFCLVLPITSIISIPNAMICPLGTAQQMTIKADGTRIPKTRLTHDQTFCLLTGSESVNVLTDTSKYAELIFGYCLHRMIYQAVSLRFHYPHLRILCSKYDFAKAYRRLHYHGASAVRCIAVFEHLAYVMLRLSFGGKSCPASWCAVSELITDLANELLHDPTWSAEPPFCSPDQTLVPPPDRLPNHIPLAPSLPTMLLPPPHPEGMTDVFVDDVSTLFLDTPENCARAPAAVPLAIHVISRPIANDEPIPRENVLSCDKLSAEGAPSETKTILGWHLDFRRLLITLPPDKHQSWSNDIHGIITKQSCTKKELEQLVGRLNHAAQILPLARFFLSRLRHKHEHAKYDRCTVYFNRSDLKILHLWLSLLTRASTGISFNLITLRLPTNIIITDACPTGIGGFSITTGAAWRLDISRFSHVPNNSLEFIASVVGILLEHQLNHIPHLGNVLALTDNSSCACWLFRSNFDPSHQPINFEISTTLALRCIHHDFTVHSQHIKGSHNLLADLLSRQPNLTDTALTSHARHSFPSQIPTNFKLYPLPDDLMCWVYSTLALHQSSSRAAPKPATKKQTAAGPGGAPSPNASESATTPTSPNSPRPTKRLFAAPSSSRSNPAICLQPADIAYEIQKHYSAGVYEKPSATWLRNSHVISGQVPFTSLATPTLSIQPFNDSYKPGKTPTRPSVAPAPSLLATSDIFTFTPNKNDLISSPPWPT